MAWALRTLLGVAAAMTAGAALACGATPCPNPDEGWSGGGWSRESAYERSYVHEERYEAIRDHDDRYDRRRREGELALPSSFFLGAGGVGPIPSDTYYSGGDWVAGGSGFAGAHASAFASARAAASARVSVSISGGCCHR